MFSFMVLLTFYGPTVTLRLLSVHSKQISIRLLENYKQNGIMADINTTFVLLFLYYKVCLLFLFFWKTYSCILCMQKRFISNFYHFPKLVELFWHQIFLVYAAAISIWQFCIASLICHSCWSICLLFHCCHNGLNFLQQIEVNKKCKFQSWTQILFIPKYSKISLFVIAYKLKYLKNL
jgi:hypothetical protein